MKRRRWKRGDRRMRGEEWSRRKRRERAILISNAINLNIIDDDV